MKSSLVSTVLTNTMTNAVALMGVVLIASSVLAQTSTFSEHDPRYRLQPSDVLEIHYRYTPEFDQTVTVQPDGFVTLQIVGDLKLQALTVEQAKASILEKASLRLKDPEVTLVLKDFEKPYFVVGGEVANPGRFEMRGTITAVQAIAMAGGFKTASAKHSQVILFRRVGPDLANTQILNLKAASRPCSFAAMTTKPRQPCAEFASNSAGRSPIWAKRKPRARSNRYACCGASQDLFATNGPTPLSSCSAARWLQGHSVVSSEAAA